MDDTTGAEDPLGFEHVYFTTCIHGLIPSRPIMQAFPTNLQFEMRHSPTGNLRWPFPILD
jgi:hypothetical protein